MSTRAATRARAAAPAPARSRPAPRAVPRPSARPRRAAARPRRAARPGTGWLVIPLVALILGGIVWVNVATLSLTNETGKVIERARSVEGETARLRATLDRRDASVPLRARRLLGMTAPAPGATRYLDPLASP